MSAFLQYRQTELSEIMDRDDIDPELLTNTYRQFSTINKLLSQWRSIYKQEIRPYLSNDHSNTLLDIGFGGGDVPIFLSQLATHDGFELTITAIEIDERAYQFAKTLNRPQNIDFRLCSSSQLVKENQSFDFVISNHVLHHLNEAQLQQVLNEAASLAKKRVIFNDIERSLMGYTLFNVFSRMIFSNSYITADGLTSIKRSYTKKELEKAAPPGWKVKRKFPYRIILLYEIDQ